MLPPFSWSFIPLYWQDGESKIMKVCKGFLWHGCRFFHLFLKHFPSLFMSFLAFYFCCVCVWDTTSHSGRAIYSSQSVEESLKGCVPSTQGLGWKTLWRKKKHPGNPAEMALSDRGILLWRILYVSSKMCSTPAAECGGAVANVCTIFTCTSCTKSFWEENGIKAKWYFTISDYFSLFLCFAL